MAGLLESFPALSTPLYLTDVVKNGQPMGGCNTSHCRRSGSFGEGEFLTKSVLSFDMSKLMLFLWRG